jgi:KUP system potassium uptake protein
VRFNLGFRIVPRINLMFRQVIHDLSKCGEITIESNYTAGNPAYISGDFRFVVLKSFLSIDNNLSFGANLLMQLHFMLDRLSLRDDKAYGLDYSNVVIEYVPLILGKTNYTRLRRIKDH